MPSPIRESPKAAQARPCSDQVAENDSKTEAGTDQAWTPDPIRERMVYSSVLTHLARTHDPDTPVYHQARDRLQDAVRQALSAPLAEQLELFEQALKAFDRDVAS